MGNRGRCRDPRLEQKQADQRLAPVRHAAVIGHPVTFLIGRHLSPFRIAAHLRVLISSGIAARVGVHWICDDSAARTRSNYVWIITSILIARNLKALPLCKALQDYEWNHRHPYCSVLRKHEASNPWGAVTLNCFTMSFCFHQLPDWSNKSFHMWASSPRYPLWRQVLQADCQWHHCADAHLSINALGTAQPALISTAEIAKFILTFDDA